MNYDELIKELRSCADREERFGYATNSCVGNLREAADAIEDLKNKVGVWMKAANGLDKMYQELADEVPDGWVSVRERMPKECEDVLLMFEHNQAVGFWNGVGWSINCGDDFYTSLDFAEPYHTHWMPLPSMEGLNDA